MDLNKLKNIAKSVLAVPFIRKFTRCSKTLLYKVLSFGRIFALPYHLFIGRAFNREIMAFTRAVNQYNRKVTGAQISNVALRRNIHRLEKGLIMENRRPLFALDYIGETVENYVLVTTQSKAASADLREIHWAHDVLVEYFSAVDASHPLIRKLKGKFDSLPAPGDILGLGSMAPYDSKTRAGLKIPPYEEFLNLTQKRRSVRWFADKKVPREAIDKALSAAFLAPSACNRQPFKYRVFDDPALVKEIANIPFGTTGYANNLPVVIVVTGDLSDFFSARDRHTIYIDTSLSAMAFMLALETLGLSSITINWPDFGLLETRMQKKLHLKAYERPVLLLGVGYAKDEGRIPYSQKKPLELLRTFNDMGGKPLA
jgi:nitroreductase